MMRRYAAPPIDLPQVNLGLIPKGYLGTRTTLKHIQALIRAGAKDFYVRQKAIDILLKKAIKPKDYLGEIKALFEWVQHNIRYTKDPFRVEVLHSARRLLELRAGDCDDMTILLGSLLESIGHPVRLVITGPDPLRPKLFSHIYLEAFHQGRWVPLDATMPYPMGWSPQTPVKQIISIERSLPQNLPQKVQKGSVLYEEFNHFAPNQTIKVRHSRLIPSVVVDLGELVGLIYRSDKGQPGKPRAYIHRMQTPPRLVSNVEGTQLYVVGGNYRVTPHGIEG